MLRVFAMLADIHLLVAGCTAALFFDEARSHLWAVCMLGIGLYVAVMIGMRIFEHRRVVPAPQLKGWSSHNADVNNVHQQFRHFLEHQKRGQLVSIKRSKGGQADSNRTTAAHYKKNALCVDVSTLVAVIAIDTERRLLHVEPGLPMDEMARIAIAHGFVPLVTLEFPGITAGGAVCGGGIESSSHRFGCFIDTVEEIDVITGDGSYRTCVSRTQDQDLFCALSVSFGTHGIITRLALRVQPAPHYVHVNYLHFASLPLATHAMQALASATDAPTFIDGVAMSPVSVMVVLGEHCDEPPVGVPRLSLRNKRSDPWFYWHLVSWARRLQTVTSEGDGGRKSDPGSGEYMTLEDYLFRFDRGAFWMARHGLQTFFGAWAYNPDSTALAGPTLALRIKYAWLCTTRQLYRMLHAVGDVELARTYIVQDFIMPSHVEACKLVEYTSSNGGIWPIWVCPVRKVEARSKFDAGFGFPATAKDALMFNIGVYGVPNAGAPFDPVVTNKALETAVSNLGGRKMLYAQNFYSLAEFWQLFDKEIYDSLRERYRGKDVFPDIAAKLLLGTRIESMRGIHRSSFVNCAGDMLKWYLSLWQEILLPRFMHNFIGIRFTGMTTYTCNARADRSDRHST